MYGPFYYISGANSILIDQIGPAHLLIQIVLPNGANTLLTPEFICETKELIGSVAPVLTPEVLKVSSLLTSANPLLTAD
jgi:hypothetical protein